jgi:hypothetical protein
LHAKELSSTGDIKKLARVRMFWNGKIEEISPDATEPGRAIRTACPDRFCGTCEGRVLINAILFTLSACHDLSKFVTPLGRPLEKSAAHSRNIWPNSERLKLPKM